jgi:hypothetical protein
MRTKSRTETEAKKVFRAAVREGQADLFEISYDPQRDIAEGVKLGLKIVKQRMADGGPGWPK